MKILLILFISITPFFAYSQSKIDSVRIQIEKNFNDKNAEKIYELAGNSFRKAISEKDFAQISKTLFTQLGKWNSSEFLKRDGKVNHYKASFERATQNFFLSLDEEGKFETLLFQPFEAPVKQKEALAKTDNPMKSKLDSTVEKLVRPYIQKENTTGLCMAVIQDENVKYYSYGETKRGNGELPKYDKTLFEIGSVSKTFTALLLANEVVDGRMSLDDPIIKYLPDSIKNMSYKDKPITLVTLSNHNSGFPRLPMNLYQKGDPADNPYKNYDINRLFTYLKNFKPYREVGGQYEYSNLAVGLLGTLIAQNNQTTYEQILLKNVCKPLHLKNTKITLGKKDKLAQGYGVNGKEASPWDLNALEGAGGIRSTVEDMSKYIQANLKPTTLKEAILLTHKSTTTVDKRNVGLGWHIQNVGTNEIIVHNGQTGGYVAFAGFDKNRQIGVVILTNGSVEVNNIGLGLLK